MTEIYSRLLINVLPAPIVTASGPMTTQTVLATSVLQVDLVPQGVTGTTTFTKYTTTTSTSTSTATTTTTSTTTTTLTSQETEYAACATNNILGPRINPSGAYLTHHSFADNVQEKIVGDAATPEACCGACQETVNCQASTFMVSQSGAPTCAIFVTAGDATCNPKDNGYFYYNTEDPNVDITFSNGPCGQMKDGGDDSPNGR